MYPQGNGHQENTLPSYQGCSQAPLINFHVEREVDEQIQQEEEPIFILCTCIVVLRVRRRDSQIAGRRSTDDPGRGTHQTAEAAAAKRKVRRQIHPAPSTCLFSNTSFSMSQAHSFHTSFTSSGPAPVFFFLFNSCSARCAMAHTSKLPSKLVSLHMFLVLPSYSFHCTLFLMVVLNYFFLLFIFSFKFISLPMVLRVI